MASTAKPISLPMNFGKELLQIERFNDFTIKASGGEVVSANFLILALNSPVLMRASTTSLEQLDLVEFGGEAVRRFIYACYTGDCTEQITMEVFREVNKIAIALNVAWLRDACKRFYRDLCTSLTEESLENGQFLFNEAGFLLEEKRDRDLLDMLTNSLLHLPNLRRTLVINFVQDGVNEHTAAYAEVCATLAGYEVHIMLEQLTKVIHKRRDEEDGKFIITEMERHLLTARGLALCKSADEAVFEGLMSCLEHCEDETVQSFLWKLFRSLEKTKLSDLSLVGCDENTIYSSFLNFADYLKSKDALGPASLKKLLRKLIDDRRVRTYEMVLDAVLLWEIHKSYRTGRYRVSDYDEENRLVCDGPRQNQLAIYDEEVRALMSMALDKFGRPRALYPEDTDTFLRNALFSCHVWQLFEPEANSRVVPFSNSNEITPEKPYEYDVENFLRSFLKERDCVFSIINEGCKHDAGKCLIALHFKPANSTEKPLAISQIKDTSKLAFPNSHFHTDLDRTRVHLYLVFTVEGYLFGSRCRHYVSYPLSWWAGDWSLLVGTLFAYGKPENINVKVLIGKSESMSS